MGNDLLRPGGRYNVKRTGSDRYAMSLPMPTDEQGMTAREGTVRLTDSILRNRFLRTVRLAVGSTGTQRRLGVV